MSCHVNKEEMSQPSVISGLQMWMNALKIEIQKMPPSPRLIAEELGEWWGGGRGRRNAKSSLWYICYSLRWTRKQDLALDSSGANESHELSEPGGLCLPIHGMLHSLTRYLIFDVQTNSSFCCKCVQPDSPSLKEFSQSYWDAVSWLRVK